MGNKKNKILMVIAPRDFRDEEYFIPKKFFEDQGQIVQTASNILGIAYGKLGGEAEVGLLLEEVEPEDFAAVVFVGGPGARDYFEDPEIRRIIQETIKAGKVLAAICIAPVILARNKALAGKKATVWHSPSDRSGIAELQKGGAAYLAKDVVVDGNLITAAGPDPALQFAKSILNKLL